LLTMKLQTNPSSGRALLVVGTGDGHGIPKFIYIYCTMQLICHTKHPLA
jgi:hypothetical protein